MTDASTAPVAANATGDASNPDIFLSKVLQKLLSEKEVSWIVVIFLRMLCQTLISRVVSTPWLSALHSLTLSGLQVKRSTNAKLKQACEAALADIGDGSQPVRSGV